MKKLEKKKASSNDLENIHCEVQFISCTLETVLFIAKLHTPTCTRSYIHLHAYRLQV